MKVALLALVATAGVLVAAADVDYGLCYNEAYNTATNDVYNDIVVQAQVDLNAGPQAYDPYGAALWNDFYGSVYPGCEEGELYEAWQESYETRYKERRLEVVKATYDAVWGDDIPSLPSKRAAVRARDHRFHMEIQRRYNTQW